VLVIIGTVQATLYLKGVYEILLYCISVYPIWINFGAADVHKPLVSAFECSVNFQTLRHIGVNEFLTVRFIFVIKFW
jgi:hypothetical protein